MEHVRVRDTGFGALSGISRDVNVAFESNQVGSLVKDTIGKSAGSLGLASVSYDSGFQGIGHCCQRAMNFVKYDIFMNFFQQVGLWFENFELPDGFKNALDELFKFISLIWTFVEKITELILFYLWGGLSIILFTIWLIQKIYDPNLEIQGYNAYGWQRRGKLWLFYTKMLVTAITTLYLPTMNSVFKVIFCDPTMMAYYEMQCYEGAHLYHLAFAFFVFLYIGLYLPYTVYTVIRKYQPVPQRFDAQGRRIDVSKNKEQYYEQYRELLQTDQCPYNFLYAGYEYGWSAYKVIIMVVKVLLVIPCIPFIHSELLSVSLSTMIVFIYCLLSTIMRPFLNDSDDWLDISARVTSLLTLIMQILVLTGVIEGTFASFTLLVLHIANIAVMVILILGSLPFVKNFFRKHFGSIVVSSNMDYNTEVTRKQMIWQRFWRGILATDPATLPAYERLLELDDIVKRVGKNAYRSGLFPPTDEIAQCRRLARELEGVDVYYKGNVEDDTYWGRMYIKPFPFVCVIVYDNSEKTVEIHDHNIVDFIQQNLKDENIVNARKIRRALRCLNGEIVHYECDVSILPLGGISCGVVPVNCHCSKGRLTVKTKSNDMFCHGFNVVIDFCDGVYTDATGKLHTDQHCKIKNKDLGIDRDFMSNPLILKLLNDKRNLFLIESKWEDLHERMNYFRMDHEVERTQQEAQMSYSFWVLIDNNHHLPREELQHFLDAFETNPALHRVLKDRQREFDSLYSRLQYFDSHPAISYWYSFWDDIYMKNSMLKQIEKNDELFNLTSQYAIAYHPVSMARLKENLLKLKLRKKNGRGLFNDKILNKLESKLQDLGQAEMDYSKIQYVIPCSEDAMKDPRCTNQFILPENATYLMQAGLLAWNGKE
ncbi:hypothetical protein TRFO_21220 [Tritrichomonas foetus]|uniref:Uncharacterized protein n=1 Tax=Tritrichomonas foetus TaxID=1144522 RepID=A0A1J4KFH9_9EUKA|nr:hypothetical protein TRFO_21220 [Tritrichomonas foetus]|eukprot:OHT09786.1 hypothetical protein TRFO_21220 [Tritrichomonas foetus]